MSRRPSPPPMGAEFSRDPIGEDVSLTLPVYLYKRAVYRIATGSAANPQDIYRLLEYGAQFKNWEMHYRISVCSLRLPVASNAITEFESAQLIGVTNFFDSENNAFLAARNTYNLTECVEVFDPEFPFASWPNPWIRSFLNIADAFKTGDSLPPEKITLPLADLGIRVSLTLINSILQQHTLSEDKKNEIKTLLFSDSMLQLFADRFSFSTHTLGAAMSNDADVFKSVDSAFAFLGSAYLAYGKDHLDLFRNALLDSWLPNFTQISERYSELSTFQGLSGMAAFADQHRQLSDVLNLAGFSLPPAPQLPATQSLFNSNDASSSYSANPASAAAEGTCSTDRYVMTFYARSTAVFSADPGHAWTAFGHEDMSTQTCYGDGAWGKYPVSRFIIDGTGVHTALSGIPGEVRNEVRNETKPADRSVSCEVPKTRYDAAHAGASNNAKPGELSKPGYKYKGEFTGLGDNCAAEQNKVAETGGLNPGNSVTPRGNLEDIKRNNPGCTAVPGDGAAAPARSGGDQAKPKDDNENSTSANPSSDAKMVDQETYNRSKFPGIKLGLAVLVQIALLQSMKSSTGLGVIMPNPNGTIMELSVGEATDRFKKQYGPCGGGQEHNVIHLPFERQPKRDDGHTCPLAGADDGVYKGPILLEGDGSPKPDPRPLANQFRFIGANNGTPQAGVIATLESPEIDAATHLSM